jgi:hypothetical protein
MTDMAWYDWITAFRDFAAIQKSLAQVQSQLTQMQLQLSLMLPYVDGKRPATKVRIDTGRVQFLNKKGRLIMSGSANVSTDHDLRVPLKWTDDVGAVSAPAAAGTTATSDNPAVATVEVAPDDLSIVVRSVADGSCNVTVTNGAMTDSIAINVVDPQASVLDVDATDAVMIPKGTAA